MSRCPSEDWDRYAAAAEMDAAAEVEMNQPIYTIYSAFASLPLCETRGTTGLMHTFAQLEPDLYEIREHGDIVATGERHDDGTWQVEFLSGVTLGPGYVVV
jgi:hypothetical protein